MASGKQSKRRRPADAPAEQPARGRQASPRLLIAVGVVLALLVAGVVLALALTGGSDSSDDNNATPAASSVETLPEAGEAQRLFAGIPQTGNVLGRASAPVIIVEYLDLQCPFCRDFEAQSIPPLVKRYVRSGQVKFEARFLGSLGPDSQRGRGAALAAGMQDKLFQFVKLLYVQQGPENSGWLTDDAITSAAASIDGLDVSRLLEDRVSAAAAAEASKMDSDATADEVQVTPTILVGRSGGQLRQVELASPGDYAAIAAAVDQALG